MEVRLAKVGAGGVLNGSVRASGQLRSLPCSFPRPPVGPDDHDLAAGVHGYDLARMSRIVEGFHGRLTQA